MRLIEFCGLGRDDAYTLLSGIVLPRPIAFVTTLSPEIDGRRVVNAAPFSSFITLTPDPPLVGFITGGTARSDTLANVRRTGQFVINSVTESMAGKIERCAEPFPEHVSEVEVVGFSLVDSVRVAPPRVQESPIHLECRLERLVEFGRAPDCLIVGEVLCAHVADEIIDGLRIDPLAWRPLGRIAGGIFSRVRELIRVEKPIEPD